VTLINGRANKRPITDQLKEMCGMWCLNEEHKPSWFKKQCDKDVSGWHLDWVAAAKTCSGISLVAYIENDLYGMGSGYRYWEEVSEPAKSLAIARSRLTALFLTTSKATRESMEEFYDGKIVDSEYDYGALWRNTFKKRSISEVKDDDIAEATTKIHDEIKFWKDPIHERCPKMALHFRILFHLSRAQLKAAGYRAGPLMTSGGNKIVFNAFEIQYDSNGEEVQDDRKLRNVVLRIGSAPVEDITVPKNHYLEIMAAKVFEDCVRDNTFEIEVENGGKELKKLRIVSDTIVNKTEWYGNIKLKWTSEYFTPWLQKISNAFKSGSIFTFEIQPLVQTHPRNFNEGEKGDMVRSDWNRMWIELQQRLSATGWRHDDDAKKQIGRPLDAQGNPADYAIYVDWDVSMPDPEYKKTEAGKYGTRWPRKITRAAVNKKAKEELENVNKQ